MLSSASIADLVQSLDSSDRNERAEAAIRLGMQKAEPALPNLRTLTNDDDALVALAAVYACWQLGEDRLEIDRVFSALASNDEALIQQAVHTVSEMGEPLVSRLQPYLNGTPETAILAVRLLEEIGGAEALAAIRAAQNSDSTVQDLIVETMEDWED